MLNDNSIIKTTSVDSPLLGASTLKPDSNRRKKTLVATVILTSLVDAFSILVIYLLVSFSNGEEALSITGDMELPTANISDTLERTTVIKVEEGRIFVEEQELKSNQLVAALLKLRQKIERSTGQDENKDAIIIQADKKLKYEVLSEVVQASNHAGFSEVRFAVIHN